MSHRPDTLDDLRKACVDLARQGARMARRMQRHDIPKRHKADASIVTEADTAVEEALIDQIRRRYPDDAIIGEESAGTHRGADPAVASRFWILDPIDGTRSYARCLPCFSCCVAVTDRTRPIAGAVVEAGSGTTFSAAAGRGAWRDSRRTRVTDAAFGPDALVAVPSKHRVALPDAATGWLNRCVIRNYGSTALHMSMVGAGLLDGAVVMECRLWDIAAAGLIVLEAGGVFTDMGGQPIFPMDIPAQAVSPVPLAIVAGGAACHEAMRADLHP